ncbi:MAG: ribonuclease III [Chloroflexi bacterium]|nr:ribonuclease III [Chloroflexota bacterium]
MESTQAIPEQESPRALAERLGIEFSDYRLLNRALTHRSYLNENPGALEDNERLEFLGDAVLDFLVGAWLYNRFPEMSEGQLTRMRSALVRTEQLAAFARKLDLGPAMRLGFGEAESGGRTRPALLCATFEALVGAIYVGAGIPVVREFVEPLLEGIAHKIYASGGMLDPKSRLQEWAQANSNGAPSYRTISESGPDHAKVFVVEVFINGNSYGIGSGYSKQSAAKAAAGEALFKLGVD